MQRRIATQRSWDWDAAKLVAILTVGFAFASTSNPETIDDPTLQDATTPSEATRPDAGLSDDPAPSDPRVPVDTLPSDATTSIRQAQLEFYLRWESLGSTEAARLLQPYGGRFDRLTDAQYAELLSRLDLNDDDDLMRWSALTGISIVALDHEGSLFYFNAHLIANRGGESLDYDARSALKTEYDRDTDKLRLLNGSGAELPTIATAGTIARFERTCGVTHNQAFVPDRNHYRSLIQYLRFPREISNREALVEAFTTLPLWFVRLMRGKAVYLSNARGRSLSMGTPVGNEIWEYYAGMMPGVFFEVRAASETPNALAHELCHVLDRVVIKGGYGRYRYPYQYPNLHKFAQSRRELFGEGYPERPPDLDFGYVSRYAKASDLENMADHCEAYIKDREAFDALATEQEKQGHDLLRKKYDFMEALAQAAEQPVALSPEYIEQYHGPCP